MCMWKTRIAVMGICRDIVVGRRSLKVKRKVESEVMADGLFLWLQNTTGRVERRWLNCLGAATWPEVVRRYCLFHMAKFQDPRATEGASESLPYHSPCHTEPIRAQSLFTVMSTLYFLATGLALSCYFVKIAISGLPRCRNACLSICDGC